MNSTAYTPSTATQRASAFSMAALMTLGVLLGLDRTAEVQYDTALLALAAPHTAPAAEPALVAQAQPRKSSARG